MKRFGGTPPNPRATRFVLGSLAASLVVIGLLPATVEAEQTSPVDLLDRAREAAQTESFDGVVSVEWYDGQQHHAAQVPVQSAGGVLRFGDEVVGAGARRMIHGTDGWLSLWGHDVTTLNPSPTAKYRLTVEPGPAVATRPTDVISVSLVDAAQPRERLYVDRGSGLLMRRELLDAHGNPYRSVAFTTINAAGAVMAAAAAASTPRAKRSQDPSPARHLKAPYKLRSRIGTGYRWLGAYKSSGVVQQYFSDGLHGLSVFEQRGHLKATETDLAGETGSGRRVEISGRTMRAYSASVGEAVVWESDGVVYTAVTDAPWGDLAGAVRDLPHGDPSGRLRRVAQAVVSMFRWR